MKKSIRKTMIATVTALLAVSCASLPEQPAETVSGQTEIQAEEPADVEDVETEVRQALSAAEIYLNNISNLSIKIESAPQQTTKNRAFAKPFVMSVSASDGSPSAGTSLTVLYPETKDGDTVTFASARIATDENGRAEFQPPVPSQSFNSIIKVFVTPETEDPEENSVAEEAAVTAPFKVRTNLLSAGGSISLVDYRQDGTPITTNSVSSSTLLMTMMQKGFSRIGNADFTSDIVKNDDSAVYRSAKALFGNASSFLIYGTVRYDQVITQTDAGYTCTLSGDITCINMKDGSVYYRTTQKATVTEDKDWNCLPNARKALAEKLADAILYGM